MKSIRLKTAACAAAMLALVQAPIAQAQDECVDQKDLSGAIVYAMPLIATAFGNKCSTELADDGFMATQGADYIAKFEAKQNASWPSALRVLQVFGKRGGKAGDMSEMMGSLPEDALRPFVDAIIGTMVAKEIKLKDCGKIERGLELMAPLPPENVGDLASFLFDVTDVKDPEVCPYQGDE